MPEISIVVPAHNEEKRINTTLESLCGEFPGQEIIVVCDGCTDSTQEIARQYGTVKIIVNDRPSGKGGAILKGMRSAKGDVIGFLDADGSFSPANVKTLIKLVGDDVDCAIASKWIGKRFSEVGESNTRKIAGRAWNLLINTTLGLKIADTQAGAKFLKRAAFEAIGTGFISSGFEFDIELLFRLKKRGFKITEVYLPFIDVQDSTFRYAQTPKMLLKLIEIRLKSHKL